MVEGSGGGDQRFLQSYIPRLLRYVVVIFSLLFDFSSF